ncbi:MAG TPA: hypothetical protein VGN11_00685 [Candidatus Baltobacteraceae bacterium]|nr:hypothetical protein [Candidatus Baltobacteraceae bacterium]
MIKRSQGRLPAPCAAEAASRALRASEQTQALAKCPIVKRETIHLISANASDGAQACKYLGIEDLVAFENLVFKMILQRMHRAT